MTTGATGQLGLALPVQGELSGTWGDTVNNGITEYVNIAIAGTLSFAGDGAITLSNTTGDASASNIGSTTAQYMAIRVTGTLTTTKVITAPSYSKIYMVENAATGGAVTFKASGQTGVSVAVGELCFVYFNGTDYVKVSSSVADGVTSITVATANGLAGTSSGGATPNLTLSTSVSGIVKGNGTAFSAATAGTDYLAPPSGTALLKANSGGALANATAGTDYLAPPSGTALLKANSGGALANATAGTDYVAPGTATSFTATQTFTGSTSVLAAVLQDAAEVVTISGASVTGSLTVDVTTSSVAYYQGNATGNWSINIRGSSGTALNSMLSTGQSVTIAVMVNQGATAYYNTSVQVDGTTSGVTTEWQGGTAPSSGNASSIDVYTYTVIKTASATYTVLASQTKFA